MKRWFTVNRSINFVKIYILLKLSRFNATPIKIPMAFFTGTGQTS